MPQNKPYLTWSLVAVIALLLSVALVWWYRTPGRYDDFAACLKEKNAIFYGAFWCPHCRTQKSLFGKSAKRLPYVECSTADGRQQTAICKEKKIEGYPTWEFADGSRESGELPLRRLAEKTGCVLPQ